MDCITTICLEIQVLLLLYVIHYYWVCFSLSLSFVFKLTHSFIHSFIHAFTQFRSPEEFKEDWQTEKIDVFSLGNIIYAIITGSLPFEEMDVKDAQEMVKNGILPKLKGSFIHSDHPIDNVLVKAMDMCFEYDWRKRARAHQVRDLLMNEMENVKELYHKNGGHDDEFVRRHQHEQHGEDGHRHNRRRH
jgi:Protein kinase domain.